MPTVRCPSCHRALNLPDGHAGQDACCPLCRTTFPAAPPAPPQRAPSVPLAIPLAGPPPPPPTPFDFEPEPETGLPAADREALSRAANWLKIHAGFGSLHLFTCGCVNVLAFGQLMGIGGERYVAGVAVELMLRLAAFGIIAAGAESMERRRSRSLATTAAVLGLLMGGYLLLWPLMILLAAGAFRLRPGLWEDAMLLACVSLVLTLLVALFGLVGGLRALVLLNKPAVLRAFQQKRKGR